jgi:hypothetical protein
MRCMSEDRIRREGLAAGMPPGDFRLRADACRARSSNTGARSLDYRALAPWPSPARSTRTGVLAAPSDVMGVRRGPLPDTRPERLIDRWEGK